MCARGFNCVAFIRHSEITGPVIRSEKYCIAPIEHYPDLHISFFPIQIDLILGETPPNLKCLIWETESTGDDEKYDNLWARHQGPSTQRENGQLPC